MDDEARVSVTITVDDRVLQDLIKNTGDEVLYIVADGVHYGIYQEFGTHTKAGKEWVPPHPFMRPAIEAVRPGFKQAFKNQLTDEQTRLVCKKAAFDVEGIAKQLAPVRYGFLKNSIHVIESTVFEFFGVAPPGWNK